MRVGTHVVSVMAAYCDLLCVCAVVSVMAAYCDLLCVCAVVSVMAAYCDLLCLHTRTAGHTTLPDDGSYVNRNMLEQLL